MSAEIQPPIAVTGITTGTDPNHAYYQDLAAWLEPDAIEAPLGGTFTYTVAAGVTKYLMLSWACYLAGDTNARYDVRMPTRFLPLRNVTIQGAGATSDAAIIDTSLPTYANARQTYYDRLNAIRGYDTKVVSNAGVTNNNYVTFLPGPYGVIITSVMIFDYAWPALLNNAVASTSWAIEYETSDSTSLPARFQHVMALPMTKALTGIFQTGYPANGSARGTLTYVILPSTWSAITDPLAPYTFRDDFMGATLDTSTVWTRAQSTSGNVEINTQFAWCKLKGDGTWGHNGAYSQASIARSAGKVFVCDVHTSLDSTTPNVVVGWSDGGGHSYTNFAHGLDFTNTGGSTPQLTIFENGNSRGAVGSAYSKGYNYRVRITLGTSSATYEIQGGPEYPAIGSGSWTTLTGSSSSSITTPLHAGFTINVAPTDAPYVGDVRLY